MNAFPVSTVSPVSPVQTDTVGTYLEGLNTKSIKGKITKKLMAKYGFGYSRADDASDDILQDIMMLIFTRFDKGLRLSDIVILNSIRHYIKKQKKPMSSLPTIKNDNGDYSNGDIKDYKANTFEEVVYNEIYNTVDGVGCMLIEGMNGKEIAKELEISEATASRRIESAKDNIRRRYYA